MLARWFSGAGGPTTMPLQRYLLGPHGSRFHVQAFAKGLLSFLGHSPTFAVRDFTGELAYDPQGVEPGGCRLTVRTASLDLLDEVRPQDRAEIMDRMRREVLDVSHYPEITFVSRSITVAPLGPDAYQVHLQGQLSLRGVIRQLEIPACLTQVEDWIGLAGNLTLRPSEYGIARVSALGGTLRLEDRLKFSFALAGKRATE